jgi:hypothetical protein
LGENISALQARTSVTSPVATAIGSMCFRYGNFITASDIEMVVVPGERLTVCLVYISVIRGVT